MASPESLKRLPFDLYGRYRLAADVIEALAGERSVEVLDVGGGPSSIEGFLAGRPVVAVDVQLPSDWHTPSPNLVIADGATLPFADDRFEVVVSLDTLEHVPPAQRAGLLTEALRVSSGWVFVACPCATPGVAEADAAVLSYVRTRFGEDFDTVGVLTEHLTFGHPDPDEIAATLSEGGAEVVRLPSGRIDRWLPMMIAFYDLMGLGRDDPVERVQAWYNGLFTLDDRRAPSYRQAFVVRLPGADGPSLDEVVDGLLPTGPPTTTDLTAFEVLREVLGSDVADLAEERARRVAELEAELARGREEIDVLTARAEAAEIHVRSLLEFRDRVINHPAMKLRRGLKRPFTGRPDSGEGPQG